MIRPGAEIHFRGNSYAPGDGYIYFIASIRGRSDLRRLGLVHMSDAWKEHMLTYYDLKKPARRPRHCPPRRVG